MGIGISLLYVLFAPGNAHLEAGVVKRLCSIIWQLCNRVFHMNTQETESNPWFIKVSIVYINW